MKWIIYKYCIPGGLLRCFAFIAVGVVTSLQRDIIFTAVGGILSFIYFVQKQKLEEIRLLKELFTEFNARYNDLNEDLNRIVEEENSQKEFESKELDILYSYFNLCGEEYFYYKQGCIFPKVWKAWRNGMKILYQNKKIREAWAKELKNDSYYGFQLSELEKH